MTSNPSEGCTHLLKVRNSEYNHPAVSPSFSSLSLTLTTHTPHHTTPHTLTHHTQTTQVLKMNDVVKILNVGKIPPSLMPPSAPSVFAAKPGWALSNPETSMAKWLTASEIAAVVSGGTAIKLEKDLFSKAGIAMNLLNQEHAAAGVAALR